MFENEQDFNNFTDYLLFVATLQPTNKQEIKAKEFAFNFINDGKLNDFEIFDYIVDSNNELFAKYVESRSKDDTTSVKTTLDKIKLDMLFECD